MKNQELAITYQNKPDLVISKTKCKTFSNMKGFAEFTIRGDINDHVLPGYQYDAVSIIEY